MDYGLLRWCTGEVAAAKKRRRKKGKKSDPQVANVLEMCSVYGCDVLRYVVIQCGDVVLAMQV
jgi:leucyl-tRNA synthetase